ncbi:DNA polymerase I, partial [Candidatus Hydrogenedentota bacterium]
MNGKQKERLYAIDGTAFAFRAFHALRTDMRDTHGRPVNAVYGFARFLLKLIREHNPHYLVVAFDTGAKTFRHERFPDYKANRDAPPDDLVCQFSIMQELVEKMGIKLIVREGVEADDVLGTLGALSSKAGVPAVIVSNDKDMLQLVNEKVSVFKTGKGEEGVFIDPAAVTNLLEGVNPQQVIDMMGLMGDSSDNIPGVPGVGPKTARKLIAEYGSIEAVYENLDSIKGKKLVENLKANKDNALLSRELATIITDVELGASLDDCVYGGNGASELSEFLRELGFLSMVKELIEDPSEELDYQTLLSLEDIRELADKLAKQKEFAFDTETTSIYPMQASLVGMSFSWEPERAYYIPVGHRLEACRVKGDADEGDLFAFDHVEQPDKAAVLDILREVLEDEAKGKIGQNIKYDAIVMAREGVRLKGIKFDTLLGSHLTAPGLARRDLDSLSLTFLGRKKIPTSDVIGKGAKAITMDYADIGKVAEYACEDADVTWRLYDILKKKVDEYSLDGLMEGMEVPLISVLQDMEMTGMTIDLDWFGELSKDFGERLEGLKNEVWEMAGEEFNINSSKQLGQILFEKLGLPVGKRTTTGYSTDASVLEGLADKHPLPEKLLEYRTLEKLRSTYVDALPRMVNPTTGRIHTSFNQTGTSTGRLSSSNPNLQNIPIRSEEGRKIRRGFVAG